MTIRTIEGEKVENTTNPGCADCKSIISDPMPSGRVVALIRPQNKPVMVPWGSRVDYIDCEEEIRITYKELGGNCDYFTWKTETAEEEE